MSDKISPEQAQRVYEKADCLHTTEEVSQAMDAVAAKVAQDLQDKNPLLLCVMVGGMLPAAWLIERLPFPVHVDYVHATRYRSGITGHSLEWVSRPRTSLRGRTVLIIDDVLDGGVTLAGIVEYCQEEQAQDVRTFVLADKIRSREPGAIETADYTALSVPNRYIFGCGLDYKEYWRNAPGIFAACDEHC